MAGAAFGDVWGCCRRVVVAVKIHKVDSSGSRAGSSGTSSSASNTGSGGGCKSRLPVRLIAVLVKVGR